MTSASTFPLRLTKVDDLTRPDHFYLTAADDCYFLGEYTARQGYGFSSTNQLIFNFTKKMDRRGLTAAAFRDSLADRARQDLTFVPVPPSKAKGDPLYDDRLLQMLRGIWPGQPADIRELVLQSVSTDAVHDQDQRPSPSDLEARYILDQTLLHPAAGIIAVVDDVVTTGAHFVAVRNKLREAFPATNIVSLFIARRVPEAVDFSVFEDLL
jgi:predicted amidophosphoribosyltransferase